MKKNAVFSALVIIISLLAYSCNKEEDRADKPGIPEVRERFKDFKLLSEWESIRLEPGNGTENYLTGHHDFFLAVPYSKTDFTELVFVKNPLRTKFSITRIPGYVNLTPGDSNELFDFSFQITDESFHVYIRNSNADQPLPDASLFDGFQFRYIVIPTSVFHGAIVNWNNYEAVARYLNL